MIELIVFLCGAFIMILEITGSRILAPFLGTSLITWTGLIGVILASLSLGYFLGGKLSEKDSISVEKLAVLLFSAGCFVALTAVVEKPLLSFVIGSLHDIRMSTIVSSIILFSPASVLLGMVSPYANRLKIVNVKTSGEIVGNLSALSTLGSILGTFLCGFVLLSYFGNLAILWGISVGLIILSAIVLWKKSIQKHVLVLLIIFLFVFFQNQLIPKSIIAEEDTQYGHVIVYDDKVNNTRVLQINRERHSAVYLDNDNLVFPYTKAYLIANTFVPEPKNTLMIGGGAYTFPKYFINNFPKANMDVVEIDPELEEISKRYFGLKENARLKIYSQDGRVFLNSNTKRYDIIFGDAFSSFYSLPYQLTTVEASQKIQDSLTEDGVFVVNVISSVDGIGSKFLRAEVNTLRKVFDFVYVFPVSNALNTKQAQNIMLVASQKDLNILGGTIETQGLKLVEVSDKVPLENTVMTDDFAPVDFYISDLVESAS